MENGLNKIKTEMKNLKTPQSSDDKFYEKMEVSVAHVHNIDNDSFIVLCTW